MMLALEWITPEGMRYCRSCPPRRISILHFVLARGIIEFPHFVVCAASGFRLLSAAIDGGALHRGFEARFL